MGDAQDVDLRDHAGRLSGKRLFTVNAPEVLGLHRVTIFRLLTDLLAVSVVESPAVAPGASAAGVMAADRLRSDLGADRFQGLDARREEGAVAAN